MKVSCLYFSIVLFSLSAHAGEVLFANYFDIKVKQPEGISVIGKIHLKRNKDVDRSAIPGDYTFEITNYKSGTFIIKTKFDEKRRIFGVFEVAPGKNTGSIPADHHCRVLLKQGQRILAEKDLVIHVVESTMWEQIIDQFSPITIANSRLYGRKKYTSAELSAVIGELERNDGRFGFSSMYSRHPSEYNDAKELDKDWEKVASHIGGLGYAYATSKAFGFKSKDAKNRERLKRAIYKSVIQYTNHVPIEGTDVMVNSTPIGTEMGDGFSRLGEHKYATHALLTHQWRIIDPLAAPLVQIWPEVMKDIQHQDEEAMELYSSVVRFYQMFFSIVPERRDMENPGQRWKKISDVQYSEGAWADANIHHRMRTLMVMPILWADYNRPITYVPYWYDDYYDNTPYEGKTFPKGWSPNGVINDVRSWCDKLSLPSHVYNQSGFHPDGTVTHHCGHDASDVAMWAYGFEWLVTANDAIEYFQHTPYPIPDENYQFMADRFNYTYRRMIYKNHLDFVVAGRNFFSPVSTFGTEQLAHEIKVLLAGKSPTTTIEGEDALKQLRSSLKNGTHNFTGTIPFWNTDYLVHRKEDAHTNYFFSVKHKSVRTAGAEDFSKVRKSWHAGSGVFQLRVDGDEYSENVLKNMDWHVLPGVTEEWRKDPMPLGPASASMPGGNEFSGIVSDEHYGLSAYHHMPIDDYTAAEALKSFHMVGRSGTAVGSSITRKQNTAERADIVTCIDQSKLKGSLTYMVNGKKNAITEKENVKLEFELDGPAWLHHENKGYLIFPRSRQTLFIKTGNAINVTATDLDIERSENYLIAIGHGPNPTDENVDGYHYVLIADVQASEMPSVLKNYMNNNIFFESKGEYHALKSKEEKLLQVAFFRPGRADIGKQWIETDLPAVIMMKDLGNQIRLSFADPLHSLRSTEVILKTNHKLKEGTYSYDFPGIKTRKGEKAVVISGKEGSVITISLPDSADGAYYNYQEQMYAGAPVVLLIEKK